MAQQQRSNIMVNRTAECWPVFSANDDVDENKEATRRWRVDGTKADALGSNDVATRQAAA